MKQSCALRNADEEGGPKVWHRVSSAHERDGRTST